MTSNRETKTPRICIIGAGFSGICMAIKLKTELKLETFTIYEACSEVGGTWLVNTYPGCACDVPSLLYSFSFAPKYEPVFILDWSKTYAPQPEILEYTKQVVQKFDINRFIRLNTNVESLRWSEDDLKWHATLLNKTTMEKEPEAFDIVINGTGKIRIPHYPKEYLGFKGPILHSAEWDHSVSLSNKRVGVVGTGASAVQIISTIAPEVQKLSVFQRKAPYIIPRFQTDYSKTAKWALANIPGFYKFCRSFMFFTFESIFYATRHNSKMNQIAVKIANWYRNRSIQDPVLLEKATPKYAMMCKRIIPSEVYYPAISRKNVDLVTEIIESVEGNKIRTADGKIHELDILILATGYQPHDFFSPMKVYGVGGVDVLENWKKTRPKGYLGILSSDMPNFFTLLGPYTAVGHNSNIFNIECQVQWTIEAIKKLIDKKARCVSITPQAENEFMTFIDRSWKGSVWANEPCGCWYVDAKGENTTLWTDNQINFWKQCRTVEDRLFEFKK